MGCMCIACILLNPTGTALNMHPDLMQLILALSCRRTSKYGVAFWASQRLMDNCYNNVGVFVVGTWAMNSMYRYMGATIGPLVVIRNKTPSINVPDMLTMDSLCALLAPYAPHHRHNDQVMRSVSAMYWYMGATIGPLVVIRNKTPSINVPDMLTMDSLCALLALSHACLLMMPAILAL